MARFSRPPVPGPHLRLPFSCQIVLVCSFECVNISHSSGQILPIDQAWTTLIGNPFMGYGVIKGMKTIKIRQHYLTVVPRTIAVVLALFIISAPSYADVILCFREPDNVRTFQRIKMENFVDPDFLYDDLKRQGVSESTLDRVTVAIDLKGKMVILDRRLGSNKLYKVPPEKLLTMFSGLPYSDGQDVNLYAEVVLPVTPRTRVSVTY